MSEPLTASRQHVALGDLRDIPARMTIPAAGRLIAGLSRAKSYELHQIGEFPAPVQRIGARFYVRGADVLRALGLDPVAVLFAGQPPVNEQGFNEPAAVNERAGER